jgi:hypothetical protein
VSDPYFPSALVNSGTFRIWNFIQSLLKDYSQRKLGDLDERHFALSGLEKRIARVLECDSSYGVFEKYLHRNLLWYLVPRNKDETQSVVLIRDIPSWSWMAYSGGIEFVNNPSGRVSWIKHDYLEFKKEHDGAINASLGKIPNCTTTPYKNCTTRLCEKRHVLVDTTGIERGWIQYDVEGNEESSTIQCVVIGRKRAKNNSPDQYYILLVKTAGADGHYKRIGVGQVQSGCVVRQENSILLV